MPHPLTAQLASLPEYSSTREVQVYKGGQLCLDRVIAEEPLELTLVAGDTHKQLATTMRTPGADGYLALGYLLSEGITPRIRSLARPTGCSESDNTRLLIQCESLPPDLDEKTQRLGIQSSSCGTCGKVSIAELLGHHYPPRPTPRRTWRADDMHSILNATKSHQPLFEQTGGSHSVWLLDAENQLLQSFEDVGRHNALDKLLGWAAVYPPKQLGDCTLLLSSRLSYELVHKAAVLGVSVVASIGAPSSLAIELANKLQLTSVGFLKTSTHNVYTNALALYR